MKKSLLLSLFFCLCASAAYAQGVRYDQVVLTDTGRPANSATVRVCSAGSTGTPCTPTASIFTNQALSVPASNPFTTDSRGNYGFYAVSGQYDIQISGSGITTATFKNQQLGPSGPFSASLSSLSLGTNPATGGILNLPNAAEIHAHTSTTGDLLLLRSTAGNTVQFGNNNEITTSGGIALTSTASNPITLTTSGGNVTITGSPNIAVDGSGNEMLLNGLSLGGTASTFPQLYRNGTTGTEIKIGLAGTSTTTGAAACVPSQNTDGSCLGNGGFRLGGNSWIGFSSSAVSSYSQIAGLTDTGISRTGAGVIAVGNGTKGDASGTIVAAHIAASGGSPLAVPTAGANVVSDSATQNLTNKDLVVASSGNNVTLVNQQGASGAITGNSAEQNVFTTTLSASQVQAGKGLHIKVVYLHSTGSASVTYKLKYGSAVIESVAFANNGTTTLDVFDYYVFNNAGVQNAQTWVRTGFNNVTGITGSDPTSITGTAAADFSASAALAFTFTAANTDAVTPKMFIVELIQ